MVNMVLMFFSYGHEFKQLKLRKQKNELKTRILFLNIKWHEDTFVSADENIVLYIFCMIFRMLF